MIAAAFVSASFFCVQSEGTPRARFSCDSQAVDVGQPFALELEITHGEGVDVRDLLETPFELDASWVIFGREVRPTVADPSDPSRRISRTVLSIASLEPGARSLGLALTSAFHDGRFESIDASHAFLEVASVLAEDEDAPRPLRGLPGDFGRAQGESSSPGFPWLATLGLLFPVALGAFLLWRSRKKRLRAGPAVDPLACLESWAPVRGLPARELRERSFELSRFVRRTVDGRLSRARDGRTDEEWLAELQGSGLLAEPLIRELALFFARTEAIKYAGVEPSEWAQAELLAGARRALELLRSSTPLVEAAHREQAA